MSFFILKFHPDNWPQLLQNIIFLSAFSSFIQFFLFGSNLANFPIFESAGHFKVFYALKVPRVNPGAKCPSEMATFLKLDVYFTLKKIGPS